MHRHPAPETFPVRSTALLLLLIGTPLTAVPAAVSEAELAQCHRIANPEAALACYRALGQPAPAPAVAIELQPAPPPAPPLHPLRLVMLARQPSSYVGVGYGLRLRGDEPSERLLYEAQLQNQLPWFDAKLWDSGWQAWVDLTVRLQVRQLDVNSKPVRTPSYNPGLRAYFARSAERPQGAGAQWYYSVGLHHYSNGQEGPPYREHGQMNLHNGSFNTNYAEFAAYREQGDDARRLNWWRLGWVQHFYGTWEPYQRGQYPRGQLQLEYRGGDALERLAGSGWQFRLGLNARLGQTYRAMHGQDASLHRKGSASDRIDTRVELLYKPSGFRELAIYLRHDRGQDEYNIHFQRRVNRVQLGLAAY